MSKKTCDGISLDISRKIVFMVVSNSLPLGLLFLAPGLGAPDAPTELPTKFDRRSGVPDDEHLCL
jgi:hypothetical protein